MCWLTPVVGSLRRTTGSPLLSVAHATVAVMAASAPDMSLTFTAPPGTPPALLSVAGVQPVIRVAAGVLEHVSHVINGFDFDGGRLVLEPENGVRVVYRVVAYDEDTGTYLLIWPD